jgi:hypothetical protein
MAGAQTGARATPGRTAAQLSSGEDVDCPAGSVIHPYAHLSTRNQLPRVTLRISSSPPCVLGSSSADATRWLVS